MIFIALIYIEIVYLVFFKFRWLPWNQLTRSATVAIGIFVLSGFLIFLKNGSMAAGAIAPLYTGGAIEAQIETANANQQAAIGAFGAAVLQAFEEVEAALTNETLLELREGFLTEAVVNNLRAYELARKQYEVGQIDLLSVLQMQSRWVGARVGLIDVKNQQLAQRINLHLALGGSFEESEGDQ